MEEAPENGKESSHSAHGNGMNELSLCACKENSVQCNVGKSVILWFGNVVNSETVD